MDGRPQPLCARWANGDLAYAALLVEQGSSRLMDLVEAVAPVLVPEAEWVSSFGGRRTLLDVDTPEDLRRAQDPDGASF